MLSKKLSKDLKVVYTHGGVFHADDIFSTALLNIWCNNPPEVRRVFNLPEDEELFAFDIGKGKFDHHQIDAEVRENGIKYAAFGLLWREIGPDLLGSKEEADKFDEEFVQMIDNSDNTGESNPISAIISSFNKNWDDMLVGDGIYFKNAVNFAQIVLEQKFKSIKSELKAISIVQKILDTTPEDQKYIIMDRFVPWQSSVIPTNKEFIIFSSLRGGYNLQVVPEELDNPKAKKDLPNDWLVNKPEGCTFVHPARFLASFNTLEDAVAAVKTLID